MSLINTSMPEGMYKMYQSKRWIIGSHPKWAQHNAIILHKCHIWSLWYEVVLNPYLPDKHGRKGTCLGCGKKAPDSVLTVAVLYNWEEYQERSDLC